MQRLNRGGIATLAALLLFSLFAAAKPAPVIRELTVIDRQFMQQQRAQLDDLAQRNFGQRFSGERSRDIALLQRLLDARVVRNNQKGQLQAMGVIIGDHLAADLGLHWVIYEDDLGRSRALRYRDTDNYLFPITMISRRREVGNLTPVADIYAEAEAAMRELIPPLPFQ